MNKKCCKRITLRQITGYKVPRRKDSKRKCGLGFLAYLKNNVRTYVSLVVEVVVDGFKASHRIPDCRENRRVFQIKDLVSLFYVPAKVISQAIRRMIMTSWPAVLVYARRITST